MLRKSIFIILIAVLVLSFPVSSVKALPNGNWQTGLKVQNLEAGDTTISVVLYAPDGNEAISITQTITGEPLTIPGGKSVEVYLPNYSLTSGQYSAVVGSTTQIGVVATLTNYTSGMADSYNAMPPATSVFVPYVYHAHNNWSTEIFIMNTDQDSDASVTVTLTNGTITKEVPLVIPVNGVQSINTTQSAYDDLGTSFIGSAEITSNTGELLSVSANHIRLVGDGDMRGNVMVSTSGMTSTESGTYVVVPSLYKEFVGASGTWRSGIKIQNTTGIEASALVTFTADPDMPAYSGVKTVTVPANGNVELYLASVVLDNGAAIPNQFKGSATIEVSSAGGAASVVASVIHTNYDAQGGYGVAMSYSGFSSGSEKVSLPSLYKWPSGAGVWVSGIKIQNVGDTATTVDVNFYSDPDIANPSWTGQTTGIPIDPGKSVELYLSASMLNGGGSIPNTWKGSAEITADAGDQIVATVIHTNYGRKVSNMYLGIPMP